MRLGFDVDDTLINLREHAFHLYNKKLNKNVPLNAFNQLKTLEIHHPFGLTDEKGKEMWHSLLEDIYFTNCSPFENAVEMLNNLSESGHEIFYITSRPKAYCKRTQTWLKQRGFPVDQQCFFCGMKDSEKVDFITNLDLDYYFDDKPVVLESLLDTRTKVYVKSQSYNQDVSLPRIVSWSELSSILKEKEA